MKMLISQGKKAQNEEKPIGEDGEVTQTSEDRSLNSSSEEKSILKVSDSMNEQKNFDREDENTTTRMETALSIVMRNFDLYDKGYVLTAFDDKGEGKQCKVTLTNGAFTISAVIHDW